MIEVINCIYDSCDRERYCHLSERPFIEHVLIYVLVVRLSVHESNTAVSLKLTLRPGCELYNTHMLVSTNWTKEATHEWTRIENIAKYTVEGLHRWSAFGRDET